MTAKFGLEEASGVSVVGKRRGGGEWFLLCCHNNGGRKRCHNM